MTKEYYENMKKNKTKGYNQKRYSLVEIYSITIKAFRSTRILSKAKKSNLISEKLQERIMLAVTSVNGCAMCSYAHTEMALKAGLSNKEIQEFVSGNFPDIPEDEAKAIIFAQHYADVRGKLKKDSFDSLVETYGKEKAIAILATTRLIMMGNAYGIPLSSFKARFKEKTSDHRSNIMYEILIILFILPFNIIGFFHVLLLKLIRWPYIRFSK